MEEEFGVVLLSDNKNHTGLEVLAWAAEEAHSKVMRCNECLTWKN
jgi:hypothetical protein